MSCSRFPSIPAGTRGLLEPIELSSSFVVSYQPHSAVLVKFHNHKDSVMRVAVILWVPTMHSGDIMQQAKGFILIKST